MPPTQKKSYELNQQRMRNLFLLLLLCLTFSFGHAQSYLGWITTSVDLREGPGTGYKSLTTLPPGTQIFITSLSAKKGFVNIIDIATNKEGFVSKSYIKVGQLIERSSEGILQNVGETSSFQPEIEIYNNTNRTLSLKMNDRLYSFYSKERKTFNLPPGNYEYRASAPGVIPDIGNEKLKNNNGYSWEFYILTR